MTDRFFCGRVPDDELPKTGIPWKRIIDLPIIDRAAARNDPVAGDF